MPGTHRPSIQSHGDPVMPISGPALAESPSEQSASCPGTQHCPQWVQNLALLIRRSAPAPNPLFPVTSLPGTRPCLPLACTSFRISWVPKPTALRHPRPYCQRCQNQELPTSRLVPALGFHKPCRQPPQYHPVHPWESTSPRTSQAKD